MNSERHLTFTENSKEVIAGLKDIRDIIAKMPDGNEKIELFNAFGKCATVLA